jgi:hypothetical protein
MLHTLLDDLSKPPHFQKINCTYHCVLAPMERHPVVAVFATTDIVNKGISSNYINIRKFRIRW